ncbi:CPBP family intramembrane glutamic endopeptidase [Peribacillus asahii]|uniref:CPBP family intramembrane glutamic endopeptidase n=1 Tax=Peribacillus asahii TaxID=228899 RepID=UPI00207AB027|nr:CPBP family intramembrane glutamic endopeptidase [Peribacillus asahii]USK72091.1 CPBP family intramembrane metalloprotease [Peribacillus asahii]
MDNIDLQKNGLHLTRPIDPNWNYRVFFLLMMRTLLFIVFGAVFVGLFSVLGSETPLKAAEKWWPFQAILANIATYFILRSFLRKEGIPYKSMFNYQKGSQRKYAVETLWLVLVGFVLGGVSLYVAAYLLFGTFSLPTTMFQEIPVWALVLALILFPLTNGLVETPTYIGYALPRLYAITGKQWLAIILAGLALAFQHVALPLVFDIPYMLWRFLSFIPLALTLGFIYMRTKRLIPIMLAHYLMDLQLVIQLALMM